MAGLVRGDGGTAYYCDRTADVDVLESRSRAPGQSRGGSSPQNMVGGLIERFYSRARQSVAHLEGQEMGAVIAIEPVLRANPKISGGILEQAQGGQIPQTL